MVGRELHMECPAGEDHQGRARGRRDEIGSENGNESRGGCGRRRRGGLKSCRPKTTSKAFSWIIMYTLIDLQAMSFVLLALIYLQRGRTDSVLAMELHRGLLLSMTTTVLMGEITRRCRCR